MSDDLLLGEFVLPADDGNGPQAFYARLVKSFPEFEHLREGDPHVVFLFRTSPKVVQGRDVLGTCYMPSVQGALRPVFDWLMEQQFGRVPDFLIVLDLTFWNAADDLTREILVHHEMMHCGQAKDQWGEPKFNRDTGLPVWCVRPHDVEEFADTVRRYGAWNEGLSHFLEAAGG